MVVIQSRFEVAVPELPDHIDPASYSMFFLFYSLPINSEMFSSDFLSLLIIQHFPALASIFALVSHSEEICVIVLLFLSIQWILAVGRATNHLSPPGTSSSVATIV